jgi:hypothetical protein
MRQCLRETACMDSLVMSRHFNFCNTTVGFRLERRRALWRVILGYTDRAPTFAPHVYLACRHQRASKTQCAPHILSHHDRAFWEHSRSIAVMGCGVSLAVPYSTLEEQFFNLLWVDPLTRCNLRGGIGVDQALIPPGPDLLVCLIIRLEETFLKNVSLRIFGHNPPMFIHGNNDLHSVSPFTRVHPCPGSSSGLLSFSGLTEPVFSSRGARTRTATAAESNAHRESIGYARSKEC